jgi:large subunit ribosomal protein L29
MEAKELKQIDKKDLQNKLEDLKEEYFNFRFQHSTSQLGNTAKLKDIRKDIARVKTVIKEKSVQR